MKIILREIVPGKIFECIWTEDFDKEVLSNGKTLKQSIQDDISSGKDTTGHAKYRKILKDAGLITVNEVSNWEQNSQVKIGTALVSALESPSV